MSGLFAEVVREQGGSRAEQGLRRAALMLYSMGLSDRVWLLDQVSAGQRQSLEPLLMELQALGVPADWQTTRKLLCERDAPSDNQLNHVMARIAAAPAEAVARVLLAEPVGLVKRALALSDWPWHAQVLDTLRLTRGKVFDAIARANPPEERVTPLYAEHGAPGPMHSDASARREPTLPSLPHGDPLRDGFPSDGQAAMPQKTPRGIPSELDNAILQHLAVALSHEPTSATCQASRGVAARLQAFWRSRFVCLKHHTSVPGVLPGAPPLLHASSSHPLLRQLLMRNPLRRKVG